MQMRHTFNALALELRLPCIKPLKLYVVNGKRSIRRSYKSDAKGVKQGYFSFPGTATFSEATKQVVFAACTCGCHIGKTNQDAASGHEIATTMSSFSEWLLWVIVFTNIAIDNVTIILTSIGAVFAINIDAFIPTYDTYDVTGRWPDGPCDQISAGYQVLVVELVIRCFYYRGVRMIETGDWVLALAQPPS